MMTSTAITARIRGTVNVLPVPAPAPATAMPKVMLTVISTTTAPTTIVAMTEAFTPAHGAPDALACARHAATSCGETGAVSGE